ncbi:MAG: beta-lactamase family protein [Burkholderiales bacterium]|nr:beta-lactamase family protein [Burkholderiales bacterium]
MKGAETTRVSAWRRPVGWAFVVTSAVLALLRPDFSAPQAREGASHSKAAWHGWLDRELAGSLTWQGVPGAAVAMRQGDEQLAWQAGSRAAFRDEPLTITSRFEAASLSKPVTAYAALRLVRQGRLQLDAPVQRGGHRFTLRQLLSHQAGFDNRLKTPPLPVTPAGRFQYAGSGYMLLGELIEQASGQDFKRHMNTVVLPELGMQHSHYGATELPDADLAQPSIDLGLPLVVLAIVASLLALLLAGVTRLACRIVPRWRSPSGVPMALDLLAMVLAGAALSWAWGWAVGLAATGVLTLGLSAVWLRGRSPPFARVLGLGLASMWILLLLWRPALPLPERRPMFLAAAGLRTTATDYALFLAHLVREAKTDPLVAEMLSPQARLSPQMSWGLGVGLQTSGGRAVAWHWGVNFPGYQALALADLQTGKVAVVLMNGGSMSFSPAGHRFGGLELAHGVATAWLGGVHGRYWSELP